MVEIAKNGFWIFLAIGGLWGTILLFKQKINPWYLSRSANGIFREKFNFYFFVLTFIAASAYFSWRWLGPAQFLIGAIIFGLTFSAAFFSLWILKRIMLKTRVHLRFLGLVVSGAFLAYMIFIICKNVIFVDLESTTIRREVKLSPRPADSSSHQVFYREYNRFYFTTQIPFELALIDQEGQTVFREKISAAEKYPAYEFDRTGQLIFRLEAEQKTAGLIIYTIEHGFSWKRFTLRNYPFYRYATLYLFLLWIFLYFSTQRMSQRKEDDMPGIEIDKIALINDLKLTLRRDKLDQNMLVAWYEKVSRKYGHKVNMENLAMQVEDIELQTKALQALIEYNRKCVTLNEALKVGDNSEMKAQIEKKRLEMEMSEIELKIERNKMAIREAQASKVQKEPEKNEFEKKLESYQLEKTIQIQQMIGAKDKYIKAKEICDQIKKERPDDGDEIAEELMRIWFEMGVIS